MGAPPKRRRVKVNRVIDSTNDAGSNEMIRAMQRLSAAFCNNIFEYSKSNMSQDTQTATDYRETSARLLSLVEEIAKIATRSDIVTPEIVRDFMALQQKILARMLNEPSRPEPLPLPEKAPELWSKRTNKSENVIEFTVRVYGPYNGRITLRDIRRLDFSLYNSIGIAKARGLKFPEWFDLPSVKQTSDKFLADMGINLDVAGRDDKETLRVLRTVQHRIEQRLRRTPT